MSDEVEILDSQVHIWGANTPERPWTPEFAGEPHGPPEVSADAVLAEMDRAGVAGAIIVPPSFEGDRNDLAHEASSAHPDRFRFHGRFSLVSEKVTEEVLAAMEDGLMLGVRLTFNAGAARWLEDGTVDWFWAFAAERDVPVSLFPTPAQLPILADIAKRHPGLKLAIDHLAAGNNPAEFDSMDVVHRLEPLVAIPNIAVKASGLPNSFPGTYSPERVREVIDLVISMFGPERAFWGSDLTRSPAPHDDYAESVRVFLEGTAHLPLDQRQLIMGGALREWFGWS